MLFKELVATFIRFRPDTIILIGCVHNNGTIRMTIDAAMKCFSDCRVYAFDETCVVLTGDKAVKLINYLRS